MNRDCSSSCEAPTSDNLPLVLVGVNLAQRFDRSTCEDISRIGTHRGGPAPGHREFGHLIHRFQENDNSEKSCNKHAEGENDSVSNSVDGMHSAMSCFMIRDYCVWTKVDLSSTRRSRTRWTKTSHRITLCEGNIPRWTRLTLCEGIPVGTRRSGSAPEGLGYLNLKENVEVDGGMSCSKRTRNRQNGSVSNSVNGLTLQLRTKPIQGHSQGCIQKPVSCGPGLPISVRHDFKMPEPIVAEGGPTTVGAET